MKTKFWTHGERL